MASLLTLPTELLQNIAGYLPCSSVLKLTCVNRQLYKACNDRLVFQEIAKLGVYRSAGAAHHLFRINTGAYRRNFSLDKLDWSEGDALLQNASLETTVRVALAVEKSIHALRAEDDEWTLKRRSNDIGFDFGDWLPHMLALHHPVAWSLDPDHFLRVQGELSVGSLDSIEPNFITRILPWPRGIMEDETDMAKQQRADFINVNFILTYTTLEHLRTTGSHKNMVWWYHEAFFHSFTDDTQPSQQDQAKAIADIVNKLSERVPRYGTFENDFVLCQATAVLPCMIFELAMSFPTTDHCAMLPMPSKMPFTTMMNIPDILRDTTVAFSTCHIEKMTEPEFLAGKWTGVYSDQRRFLGRRQFDPPMRDINLIARTPGEDDAQMGAKTMFDPESRGVDAHGEFSIRGHVWPNGMIRMHKRYIAAGWVWGWRGWVTPFGIVGVWGGRGSFGGYFWVWKQDWC
ncbi:hypothetical protein IQ07DRAFT_588725 [Pyrenochaeta sp. DS3sAY3a]|nr:hypothetical protein IQ07DRAFT_588725 [Pyrenochaeta sp. DS3sAY3a]